MVAGGSLGWAWAPRSSTQHPLSGKETFIMFSVDYNAKSRGHYGNSKLKSYVCTELSGLLSQRHSEAATQLPLTLWRQEIWEQRRLKARGHIPSRWWCGLKIRLLITDSNQWLSTSSVPGALLSTSVCEAFNPPSNSRNRCYFYCYFIDEETEAQKH